MTFTLSEAEHLKLREVEMHLGSNGTFWMTQAKRRELHDWLVPVLHRFEEGLKDGSIEYMSAHDLLDSQLRASLAQLQEAAE